MEVDVNTGIVGNDGGGAELSISMEESMLNEKVGVEEVGISTTTDRNERARGMMREDKEGRVVSV